jgi:uncharacterized RDD family membrane protein YckC
VDGGDLTPGGNRDAEAAFGEPARGYGSGPAPPGAFAPRTVVPWPPPESELAGWGRRAVATLIDGLIVGTVTLAALAALGAGIFGGGESGVAELIVAGMVGALVFGLIALIYAPAVMAKTNGQTLGKMVANCRVVRAGGKRTDFWWSAFREVAVKGLLVGVLSSLTGGIVFVVDVLWPLFDTQNRALHDWVVDSRVVRS